MGKVFKKLTALALSAAMIATLLPVQPVKAEENSGGTEEAVTIPQPIGKYTFDGELGEQVTIKAGAQANGGTQALKDYETEITYAAGRGSEESDKSVQFSNSKNYGIQLPETNLENYTLSFWTKAGGKLPENTVIAYIGGPSASSEKWVAVAGNNNTQTAKIWTRDSELRKDGWDTLCTSQVTTEKWSNIVISQKGDRIYIYQNGQLMQAKNGHASNENIAAKAMEGEGQHIVFGTNPWDPSFNGYIDDVQVWDQSLTESQVKANYLNEATDEEKQAWLESTVINASGSLDCITKDLPTDLDGIKIAWTSDAADTIDNIGKLIAKTGKEVNLTASVSYGEDTLIDSASLKVTAATEVTVKFVDSAAEGGEALKTQTITDLKVGDAYTYTIAEDETTIITEDGKRYTPEKEPKLTIEALGTSDQNIITISCTENTDSIKEQGAAITIDTREGIAPVLPEKAEAVFESKETNEELVTWNTVNETDYAVGKAGTSFEVNGTFTGTEVAVKATVNVKSVNDYLMAAYSFDEEDLKDSVNSDNTERNAQKVNTVNTVDGLVGKAIELPGGGQNAGSVKLPDDLLQIDGQTQDDFTVSMFLKREATGNCFAMILHGTQMNQMNPTGYLGLINHDKRLDVEFSNDGSIKTKVAAKAADLTAYGEWTHIAIVVNGSEGKCQLYKNGALVASADGITVKPSDLTAQNNYLGKASWPDNDWKGAYDEFAVYQAALTADEIKSICDTTLYDAQLDKAKEELELSSKDASAEFDANAVTADLNLPTAGTGAGTTVAWESSNPGVIAADGTVTRPVVGQEDAEVTLTATITAGNKTDTKTFTVTVSSVKAAEILDPAAENLIQTMGAVKDADGKLTLNVTSDTITLPTEDEATGTSISWTSTEDAIINAQTGAVALPENVTDTKNVTLKAVISTGVEGVDDTKEVSFVCNVYQRIDIDTTALSTVIAEITALNLKETDYTSATWSTFADALAKAQTQVSRPESDATVAAAKTALETAKEGLVRRADLTALNAAIAEAEGKTEADYTKGSWAAVKTALEEAKEITDNDIVQSVADEAKTKLDAAIAGLVEIKALKDAVAEAEALVKADYTVATWTPFEEKLTAAKTVLAKDNAEKAEIDTAAADLAEAKGALKTVAQENEEQAAQAVAQAKAETTAAITSVQEKLAGLKEAEWQPETWSAVQTAITNANAVLAKENATAEEITAAKDALNKAYENLKKIDSNQGGQTPTDQNQNGQNQGGQNPTDQNQGGQNQEVKVTNIKFAVKSYKIAAGKKVTLKPEVAPANAVNKAVEWKSSNTKYATVKNGKITTKKAGAGKKVTITATAKDGSGVKATVKVTIMKHAVTKVSLKSKKMNVRAGKKVTLKPTVRTSGKKVNKTLAWTSSNTKYATVSKKGVVTTKKAGAGKKVTITVTSTDGTNKKAKITINITK